VSIFIGLAVRMKLGSRIHVALHIEQISIRSEKNEGMTCFEGVLVIVGLRSSSLSEDEEGGDEDDDEPNESSESGDDKRGVARIVLDGDPIISVGGRIFWSRRGVVLYIDSPDIQGRPMQSCAEGRSVGSIVNRLKMNSIASSEHFRFRRS
jgi:hypothetical protein